MSKRNKILYWIATLWLSLGMVSTAIVQLLQVDEEVANMARLGYPGYFLVLLGVWKILGVVALLIPKTPLLKEWAYAGFFFAMSGAAISHWVKADPIDETVPSILLLILTVISWYLRPADRKLIPYRHESQS